MRPSARPASGGAGPARPAAPIHRYAHPIPAPTRLPAVISREGIEWIYAALYAQSLALEEIRALLRERNGNKM